MSVTNVSLRILKTVLYFGIIIFVWLIVFGAGIGIGYFNSLISKTEQLSKVTLSQKINDISEVSQMNYSNNQPIAMISSDLTRTRVESNQISDYLKNAVIATEDEYFRVHKGFVPKAVLRAMLGETLGLGSSSGGSTLTQQLVKQQILGDSPTFKRKAEEIMVAKQIEKYFTKDEILTTYLNVSPFGRNNRGENIAGAEAAANGIFGVPAKDLSIAQAAFIAGLPQSPIVYSPYAADGSIKAVADLSLGLKRKDAVLFNMYREKFITKQEYETAKRVDLTTQFLPQAAQAGDNKGYLYYVVLDEATKIIMDQLIKEDNVTNVQLADENVYNQYYTLASQRLRQNGYQITSTIDQSVYEAMQNAVANFGYLAGENVQVGNVLMDNATGAILGFVGGRDFQLSQVNHAFDTIRSPGSSIKPVLVYGPAIDQGLIGSATMLSNYPTNFSSGEPIYHDGNKGTNEMMNLQTALNWSWNIPAYLTYQTLRQKGVDVAGYMTKMGYSIPDYSIESLPMGGGADMTVAEQVNGYQTLANHGEYHQKYLIDKITDKSGTIIYQHTDKSTQVFSKATASIVNKLLEGVLNSNITTHFKANLQGMNPAIGNADWVGKTGTSNDFGDSWLIVSTKGVTLGGWSGIDDHTPMSSNSGEMNSSYMSNLVNAIYQANPAIFKANEQFDYDSSVIKSTVLTSTGEKPAEVEVNKKKVKVSGDTTTSYYAKTGAPNTTYRFGIGGSDADYQKSWDKILGSESSK
ncbi:MAG: penicillin-binding protein [Streptococcaceae bacterium]|nr:penicillin-binding protein [Streptococcaceae bacterium]